MTIELPGPLVTVLDIVGMPWPRADEDKLFAAGQQWASFADRLGGAVAPASTAGNQVAQGNNSQSTTALGASVTELTGQMGNGVSAARLIGAACTAMGTATVVLKGAIIVQLGILAAELAEATVQAIATGIETLGIGALISAGQGAAEVVATRAIIRELLNKAKSVILGQIKGLLDKAKELLNGIKNAVRRKPGELAGDASKPGARLGDPARVGGWQPSEIPPESRILIEDLERSGVTSRGGGRTEGPTVPKHFENDGRGGGTPLPATDKSGKPIEYAENGTIPSSANPKPGGERIVTGSDGSIYYSPDHYQTWIVARPGS